MHDKFTEKSVIFLEQEDFDTTGKFIKEMHGKSMLVMVGATFCGFCTEKGAPVLDEFANANKIKKKEDKTKIIIGVVYADGSPSERGLASMLGQMLEKRSIPMFIMFGPDGKIKDHMVGAVEPSELQTFVNKNL